MACYRGSVASSPLPSNLHPPPTAHTRNIHPFAPRIISPFDSCTFTARKEALLILASLLGLMSFFCVILVSGVQDSCKQMQ